MDSTNQQQELQNQLLLLQQEYEAALPERLDEVETRLRDFHRGVGDAAVLRELHRIIHRLAGSGTTFGFKALSEQSRDIERILKSWLEASTVPASDELRKLDGMIAELRPLMRPASRKVIAPLPVPVSGVLEQTQRLLYLVEDDPDLREELVLQLRHYGIEVDLFHNATEAAEAIRQRSPDVVLVDMVLPEGGLAGAEMIRTLRKAGNVNFPVMFMSVRDDYQARLAAVRAGTDAYLVKPLEADRLVEQIDRVTHRGEESPYRVLLVDDDVELATRHALVLRSAGMIAEVADEPGKAMDQLATLEPDLLLMDLYMPDCSGLELAQLIRQQDRFLNIPIIFLSTELDLDAQFDALRMGGDEFLTKPIRDGRLVDVVTTRARRARKLHDLMSQDSLTGLLKHTMIKERVAAELLRLQRDGGPLSFAMIDIDHFKAVNDHHGHLIGDRVIKSLANLLKHRVRGSDVVGRYGGEEFAVILPDCPPQNAATLLDDLRNAFAAVQHGAASDTFTCTFSAGIASCSKEGNAEALIRAADATLYQAKKKGRNCVLVEEIRSV